MERLPEAAVVLIDVGARVNSGVLVRWAVRVVAAVVALAVGVPVVELVVVGDKQVDAVVVWHGRLR